MLSQIEITFAALLLALLGCGAAGSPPSSPSLNVVTAGSDLYVATSGNDASACTQTKPCRTVTRAGELVGPGSTVHVAPGVYDGCITTAAQGRENARIRYVSEVRYGAHLICTAGGSNTIWHSRGSYSDIVGFDIDGQNHPGQSRIGVYFDADTSGNLTGHNRLLNTKIHGLEGCSTTASPTGTTEFEALSPANVYDSNIFFDIGNTCQAQGFASGVAGEGVYISNPDDVVTNNIIYHISHEGSSSGSAVFLNHGGVGHDVIANNLMFNNGNGVVIDWQAPSVQSGLVSPRADFITVANNIIVNSRSWGVVEHDYGCLYAVCLGNIGTHNYYENNLVFGNVGDRGGRTGNCGQIGGTKYNFVIFNGHCPTKSLSVDPAAGVFVKWRLDGSGDYHLSPGSPAIDAGEGSGGNGFVAPGNDFDGNTRPQHGAWDLGPYEYIF